MSATLRPPQSSAPSGFVPGPYSRSAAPPATETMRSRSPTFRTEREELVLRGRSDMPRSIEKATMMTPLTDRLEWSMEFCRHRQMDGSDPEDKTANYVPACVALACGSLKRLLECPQRPEILELHL